MIFGYPNTDEANLDLINYLYYHNDIRIYNLELELKGNYTFANLNLLFNDDINNTLKTSFKYFDKVIKGFNNDDVVLAGVESRTSSSVRIIRDDNMESNIEGIYPWGEGAGYAGGITTSAVDGIKVSEKIMQIYKDVIDE